MKIPRKVRRYCKHCKTHTEQDIKQAKKRERGSLKKGSMARLTKRGLGKAGFGNHGKYSKGAMSKWKRYGAKVSKKLDLRYQCRTCNKISVQRKGIRTKKPVFE